MKIDELFDARCRGEGAGHADMLPHMRQLRDLAAECSHATEFGVRTGQSTIALLAGLGDKGELHSYDLNPPQFTLQAANWHFTQCDTSKLDTIAPTELLFIDTLHTAGQVAAELRHARHASRFIAFHDVRMFGWSGEWFQDGILPPILDFMRAHRDWVVRDYFDSQWGLLVLERL